MDYSRQIKVLGKDIQKKIRDTEATIVGAGGLGNFTAISLSLLGVKKMTLIDFDEVETSNLHRQPLFSEEHVGEPKVEVAKKKLEELNPDVEVKAIKGKAQQAREKIDGTVFDGTDNFETRYFINSLTQEKGLPFFHAAVSGYQGQVMAVLPDGPCLKCVFPKTSERSCEEVGVVPSYVQETSSIQVNEFIKYAEGNEMGEMISLDFKNNVMERIDTEKRGDCPACSGEDDFFQARPCEGKTAFAFYPKKEVEPELEEETGKFDVLARTSDVLTMEKEGVYVVLYKSGKILVKEEKERARQIAQKVKEEFF